MCVPDYLNPGIKDIVGLALVSSNHFVEFTNISISYQQSCHAPLKMLLHVHHLLSQISINYARRLLQQNTFGILPLPSFKETFLFFHGSLLTFACVILINKSLEGKHVPSYMCAVSVKRYQGHG